MQVHRVGTGQNFSEFLQAVYVSNTLFCAVLNSSVGTTTRYGWTVPGIESRWGRRDYPHPSRPALGHTQPPIRREPSLFRGLKRPGRGVDHTPQLAPRLNREYSYTIVPPLGIFGLFYGDLCIYHVLRLLTLWPWSWTFTV